MAELNEMKRLQAEKQALEAEISAERARARAALSLAFMRAPVGAGPEEAKASLRRNLALQRETHETYARAMLLRAIEQRLAQLQGQATPASSGYRHRQRRRYYSSPLRLSPTVRAPAGFRPSRFSPIPFGARRTSPARFR